MANDAVKLTKKLVEEAKPQHDDDVWFWDSMVEGFGLRVYPSGRKAYVVKYSLGRRGRSPKLTIGKPGAEYLPDPVTGEPRTLTVELARFEATRLRVEAGMGRDPAAARETARAMPTLKEFSKRYLSDHAKPHTAANTAEKTEGYLNRLILPKLGSKPMDRISAGDVARFHLSLQSTPTQANLCIATISHMFTMARTWGILPPGYPNPCQDVKRFPMNKRQRYLNERELADVGEKLADAELAFAEGRRNSMPALKKLRSNGRAFRSAAVFVLDQYVVAGIRLLIFTGVRISEIMRLKWTQVDLEAGVLRQIQTKNGRQDVLLSPPAVAVLQALERRPTNPYVLPARRKPGSHITSSGLSQAWDRFRKAVGIPDVRVHDLRHSFASIVVSGGGSLPIIGALLGHSRPETTARYAHLFTAPLRLAMNAAGETIDAMMRSRQKKE